MQNSPFGIGAPKGTPPDVVKKLHDAFKQAMEEPSYVAALGRYDMLPNYMSTAAATRKFAQDTFATREGADREAGAGEAAVRGVHERPRGLNEQQIKGCFNKKILVKASFDMARITGTHVVVTTLSEAVRAFVPHPLPPADPSLASEAFVDANRAAELALARLTGVAGLVPSVDWLLYSAVRKEALLTSQIEGTQATLIDLFDEEAGIAVSNADDVEEVTNYLRAFRHVREALHDPQGLPISVRLLCDAHRLLLDGVRGAGKQPGELRKSQNWIGGTRPGNAVFVPPPADQVAGLLGSLERFIHDEAPTLPPLVRVALVHAQFETIHPFLDGNGRIGRLLIAALLESVGAVARAVDVPERLPETAPGRVLPAPCGHSRTKVIGRAGSRFSWKAWKLPRHRPNAASWRLPA